MRLSIKGHDIFETRQCLRGHPELTLTISVGSSWCRELTAGKWPSSLKAACTEGCWAGQSGFRKELARLHEQRWYQELVYWLWLIDCVSSGYVLLQEVKLNYRRSLPLTAGLVCHWLQDLSAVTKYLASLPEPICIEKTHFSKQHNTKYYFIQTPTIKFLWHYFVTE